MDDEQKNGPGPRMQCTVVAAGVCGGAMCALHGACPHEKSLVELKRENSK